MSDLNRPKTVQAARKAHRCEACYGPIPKGEVYTQQTGFWEGSAYRHRYHNECWEVLSEEGEFEYTPGELPWPERLNAQAAPTPTQVDGQP